MGEPTSMTDGRTREGTTQELPLWRKLIGMYGEGERPALRIKLFQRVQHLVDQHGKTMINLVREAITLAKGSRQPGHYFCRAIKAKISEAGFLEELP